MVWTTKSFSAGEILTATHMNNIQANFTAFVNADVGAPKVNLGDAIDVDSYEDGSQFISVGGTWTPTKGVYIIVASGGVIELYFDGAWRKHEFKDMFLESPVMLICDGVNQRIKHMFGVGFTCYYKRFI